MVELEQPFICPRCGAPLTPPAVTEIKPLSRRPAVLGAAFAAVAILVGTAVLARVGFFIARKPEAASTTTVVPVAAVLLEKPGTVTVQDALVLPPPATLPAEQMEYPAGAGRTVARRSPADRTPSTPGFLASRHHANVHVSFPLALVSDGLPEYPEQYQDGRSGNVTVVCRLQPDGSTKDCRTIKQTGGPIFDVAVHSWLDLRDVRFKPVSIRRHLPGHVTLAVHFIGDAPSP